MKLLSRFILFASSVCVCYSQVAVTSDTNITLTIASNGTVTEVQGLSDSIVGNLHSDMWAVGVKDSDVAPYYSSTCNFSNAVVVNFTSAKSVVVCNTSSLVITNEFTKSKSTQMIKGTITLTNNGSSALPVVHYRRFTDYDAGDSNNNYLANYGIASAANLIQSCFAKFSVPYLGSITFDFAPACALALAVTAAFDDYTALYEYKFGPIAAGSSVTFNVYYGASAGAASSIVELAKECVEVGSLFKPSPNGFNYTYYIGYSGVGGNKSTFGTCASAPVPVPVPIPVPVPLPVPVPAPVTVTVPVTAPVPAPVPDPLPAPVPSCFSVLSTVDEKERGIIPITELKIGDYVKTGTGIYTQVYGFEHLDHYREETFIQIHLEGAPVPLEITSNHLVFVGTNDRPYPVVAAEVVVGDMLTGKKVMSLAHVVRRGVYAPLTMSGDIAVNGVTASNYIDPVGYSGWHDVAHAAFGPQRLFCRYFMETCMRETYIDGYGRYTRFLLWCSAVLSNLGWMASTFAAAIRISVSATMPVIGVVGMLLILVIVMKHTKRDS